MTVLETRPETKSKSVYASALDVEEWDILRQENEPETKIGYASEFALWVERTDISFEDVPGDKVRIHITVHNRSAEYTHPTTLRVESAPLGAFVPWKPLTVLPVRAMKPGESLELTTEVSRPHPTPLGDFDRVPPQKVLTALSAPDEPPAQAGPTMPDPMTLLAKLRSLRRNPLRQLPPDPMELLGRSTQYWAGNLNVFVGSREVERHMAKALRIYPGLTNMAAFIVGGHGRGRPDAYKFEIVGLGWDWEARLQDATNQNSLVVAPSNAPIQEGGWVQTRGGLMVILAVHPPAGCQKGDAKVHVTQKSSGKTAIVEFSLDPAAQGSGCYTI